MVTIRQQTLDYLHSGGNICFRNICKYCHGASVTYPTDNITTYVEEVKYFDSTNKEYILDIGGVNEKGVVVFGIIFCNNILSVDENFIWPQILTSDIINTLKNKDNEELIFLSNLSNTKCDNKLCTSRN